MSKKTPKEIINALKNWIKLSEFDAFSKILFLKEPIKIGENDNGDILCVYIDWHVNKFYDEDHISLHVIMDEHQRHSNIYSRDYEFTYLAYENEDSFKHTQDGLKNPFTDPKNHKEYKRFEIYDNALELILNAINNWGVPWVEHQKNLQIRHRYFHQYAMQSSQKRENDKPVKKLSWRERIEWTENNIEYDRLMWNRECFNSTRILKEMKELGCRAFDKKQKEEYLKMKPLIDKIMKEIKDEDLK